ncbi:hypothetical protein HMI54_008934 [Coelomomyces lativittatus]|nr:hypothetical protein HMI54_008934 [Coelomomyces lativittatus]
MVSMLETHSKSVTHPTSSSSSSSSSWILDGFPRSLDQVHHLHHVWGVTLDGVIHLDVSTQVLMDRITQRWIHVSSGRTYHTTYNPPRTLYLDDVTNEKLQQREEDTPAVFQTRLQTYMTQIQPVLEYYQSQHSLVSFQGDTSDAIYPKLVHWVTQLMKKKQN